MNDFRRMNERAFRPNPDHDFRARMRQHLHDVNQAYELRNQPQEEWPPDTEWGDRMPPDDEYRARSNDLLEYGIQVHTQVRFDTATPEDPLLIIQVDKLPNWNTTDWVSNAPVNPLMDRHVSIAYHNSIRRIAGWGEKLERLYEKFDNKDMWLYGSRVTSGATLVLDPVRDPIASDAIVQEFHNTLKRWQTVNTNDMHDPNYHNADNWVEVVPEMHISM